MIVGFLPELNYPLPGTGGLSIRGSQPAKVAVYAVRQGAKSKPAVMNNKPIIFEL